MGTWTALLLLLAVPSFQAEDEAAVRSLIEKLGSDDIDERGRASLRLREIGGKSLPELKKAGEGRGEIAARARDLVRLLETENSLSPRVRKLVPKAVERLLAGEATVIFLELTELEDGVHRKHPDLTAEDFAPLATPALKHATDAQRRDTIGRIGDWDLRSAAPEALKLLTHRSADIREDAANLLGRLRARETRGEVLKLLADPHSNVRGAAARVLGELGATEAIPQLVERLKDKGETGDGLFVLEEPGVTVRAQAAASLCMLGDARGIEGLLESWDTLSHWGVCLNALRRREVWNKLETTTAKAPLKGTRKAILEALAEQGGLSLDLRELGADERKRWLSEETELPYPGSRSLLELLDEKASGGLLVIVFESDRLRLLPYDQAALFWRDWVKSTKALDKK